MAAVSEPFARGWISHTFSLRLDWSPDGGHLAAVNSFQSPCHTVALLDRADWSFDFSMVGHRGALPPLTLLAPGLKQRCAAWMRCSLPDPLHCCMLACRVAITRAM